jgi:hypothetical protein
LSSPAEEAPFILTEGGYARLDKDGAPYGSIVFDPDKLWFEKVLQSKGSRSVTYKQVQAYLQVLAVNLATISKAARRQKGTPCPAEFNEEKFKEFLQTPTPGGLPVSDSAVAAAHSLALKLPVSRAQQNLLILLAFGTPVGLF